MIGCIKYPWGWEWSVYVHLYGYVWRTIALSKVLLPGKGKVFVVELAYNSMMLIVIVDGFYLQEYFRRYFVISSSKPFRWHRATVWSKCGFVWNSESRGRLRTLPTSTGHGKSIIFQCFPDHCRELFLRRFPYPSNAIVVVVCPLNSLVKSHIRELHTRGKQQNELISFYFRGQNETDYNRISILFNTITDNI